MSKLPYQQEPVAIIGFACRLPGGNDSPQRLWEFLERGGVAFNKVPESRFNIDGHYDASLRPGTMRPKGGMFLDIDVGRFDASFFGIGGIEATAMDPNQRQMLEVVFEGLESAGMPLEEVNGKAVGCFVGSYSSDYADMQNRDASDRPPNFAIGVGRSIMANRLSYFLNIKGPSITIDTACSGSLVCLDLASRFIQAGEINSAIVAASNIYLNPDHVIDVGSVGQAQSPTAICHTFDVDADGYVKAEAVNCLIVKKLSDALRDRDPIRAIVRGTASNSNGRTVGIASPSSVAQAAAIKAAYANAGISNFNETTYLECHGTGTQAGDPTEVDGIGSVFANIRSTDQPLIIGSIKSNVGHAEPAAGISGLIKTILSMERGIIPGTPSFIKPNPKIDFVGNRVKATRTAIPWPDNGIPLRRASINSFGMGGSNAHAIVDQPSLVERSNYVTSYKTAADENFVCPGEETEYERPYVLVLSANDATSIKGSIQSLCRYLINPRVRVNLTDLAYTLSQRRSRFWHCAFLTTKSTEIEEKDFVIGKSRSGQPPKIAMAFTGQGAQWPQMGKAMLETFPWTRSILEELDRVLQAKKDPPKWSIITELTESRSPDHMRQPELAQTLTTALQLCIVAVLYSWGAKPSSVVGHSSGEIAAAYAAGLIDLSSAITTAFYRGRAAEMRKHELEPNMGMIAVGLSAKAASVYVERYPGSAWIACFNSPESVTISGRKDILETISNDIKAEGHFARALLVDLAYHSPYMNVIGDEYLRLLSTDDTSRSLDGLANVTMFSSVTGTRQNTVVDSKYWNTNLLSPVRFNEALQELLLRDSPNMLVEIGPTGALAAPIAKILQSFPSMGNTLYHASWSRGAHAANCLLDVAGHLFCAGAPIDMSQVNGYIKNSTKTIVDLPCYSWNHSTKYWHENAASKDWRFKQFLTHELLGNKIPGTLWSSPTWRGHVNLTDVPWLRDHVVGSDILMPGAGYVTLALEAMYQKYSALNPENQISSPNELSYRLRNVRFERAMVLEEDKPKTITLTLTKMSSSKDWHEFRVQTVAEEFVYEHCHGLVRIQNSDLEDNLCDAGRAPLRYPQSSKLWYKAQREVGMDFGPAFQKIESIEAVRGKRTCRSILSLEPPASKWNPASYYPLHPAVLDACFQTVHPANVAGERSGFEDVMIPSIIDDVVINKVPKDLQKGLSVAHSIYGGRGRKDSAKSWGANISVYNPANGELVVRVTGLNYIRLDVDEAHDPHVFHCATWKPDISFLDQSQLNSLLPSNKEFEAQVSFVIDLIAHKSPRLRVLEVNLDETDMSCLWFKGENDTVRAAYTGYDFLSTNAKAMVTVQELHQSKRDVAFHSMPSTSNAFGDLGSVMLYDFIILKTSTATDARLHSLLQNLQSVTGKDAFVLCVHHDMSDQQNTSDQGLQTNSMETSDDLVSRAIFSAVTALDSFKSDTLRIGSLPVWLLRKGANNAKTFDNQKSLEIAQFQASETSLLGALKTKLEATGWSILVTPVDSLSFQDRNIPVVVVADLINSVLKCISAVQWDALKRLIFSGKRVLWMTEGAQASVTNPDNALVQGLFRTARRELPDTQLTILDVEPGTGPSTNNTLEKILHKLRNDSHMETEYVERNGMFLIERLIPNVEANNFRAAWGGRGSATVLKNFYDDRIQIQLRAQKIGMLESLTWCETAVHETPLETGMAEIEVKAVGVNFKDVAITMGLVPDDEHMIGCECAGYVTRLSPNVTKFKIGDRVIAQRNGTYANRVQCPIERLHAIPDCMSFEDAATIPLVYLTAIYGLYHLAGLREGQTVLIHSAAGGVGIAAIQLARFRKAEVFATVSTDEKREFLTHTFGIPTTHIGNSRNARFAQEFRDQTNGRGIDVILNSLTGELLDESWRLLADGGVMVEIGKRDIIDRNVLSMEPFDRNCSFRALDLSYTKEITDDLIERLLNEIFHLVESGDIKPIHPIKTYSFDQVIAALTHMKRGQHIGKIVISSYGQKDVQTLIKPAVRKLRLRPDTTYLIVGGLKGLCGSVAIHMAQNGARHLIVMSRSGLHDEVSAKIIEDCAAYGCDILEARGDVGDMGFVRRVFQLSYSGRIIAGVVQGAMVLRDRPMENMTCDEYHTAIYAKIVGTWNLHRAAQEELKTSLDFFTMLSSISGVVGNKGQANYAAANTFLDAFASYRHSMGLRAHTVDLGAIEDIGYIAEQGTTLKARFERRQWVPINDKILRKIISYSIIQQDGSFSAEERSRKQLVTGLAYPLAEEDDLVGDQRFAYLFNRHSDSDIGALGDSNGNKFDQTIKTFRTMVTTGEDAEKLASVALELLQTQVAKLLQLEKEANPGRPLMAYGLDSLSAVELRGWIRQNLDAELSTLDITNASSLTALSEKLVSRLP